MALHSSTLAWKIPWTEEPGVLQSMGSQRVRYKLVTEQLDWDMKSRLRLESSQNSDWDLNLCFFFVLLF